MKNRQKITAFAALVTAIVAAALLFACAVEVDVPTYNYKLVNQQFDPGKNSTALGLGYVLDDHVPTLNTTAINTTTPATTPLFEPLITITFKADADVLKNSKIQLEDFLSFHQFSKAAAGLNADELTTKIDFEEVSRSGTAITVRLFKDFRAETIPAQTQSAVIVKIDGTKFTYRGGLKLDVDGDGNAGERINDDLYLGTITFPGFLTATSTFVEPGQRDWTVTFNTAFTTVPASYPTPNAGALAPFTINAATVAVTDSNAEAIAKVVEKVRGGFKLQKYDGTKWVDTSLTADFVAATDTIAFNAVTAEEFVPYRVRWSGSSNLVTDTSYFGVPQKIAITGGVSAPQNKKEQYARTEAISQGSGVWFDSTNNLNITTLTSGGSAYLGIESVKKDVGGRNVVVELMVNAIDGNHLDTISASAFKENFKIAYRGGTTNDAPAVDNNDIVFINYDVTFESHPSGNGISKITLKLDPNYKTNNSVKGFYISNKIKYAGNKGFFGYPSIMNNNHFRFYTPVAAQGSGLSAPFF